MSSPSSDLHNNSQWSLTDTQRVSGYLFIVVSAKKCILRSGVRKTYVLLWFNLFQRKV